MKTYGDIFPLIPVRKGEPGKEIHYFIRPDGTESEHVHNVHLMYQQAYHELNRQ